MKPVARCDQAARNDRNALLIWLLIASLCGFGPAAAETSTTINVAGAYYLDSRGFSTASIGLSAKRLPLNFSLWGFTDFHGEHDSDSLSLNRSFSEYRLSHPGLGESLEIPGLSFQLELNALSGTGNDLVRAGLTYQHHLPLPWVSGTDNRGWLQWRVFPYETDDNGGQASVIFYLPFTDRIQLKGFADYNVIEGSRNRWVIEPELSIGLSERLSALLEYRYNGFEDSNPSIRGSGLAVGFRYQFLH